MKVTCQSCQAKYTIADEKVRGKVAKIRCKKCGTTIIVDGNEPAASGVAEPPGSGPVSDFTQQGASDEQWTVLVADGDQRALNAAQVAELYKSGTVGFETLVWRDGMADWTAIAQVDALRSVLQHGPRPTMTPLEAAASMPSSAPPPAPSAVETQASRDLQAMTARAKAAEPVAARRPGRGGSTDLFGAAAQEDVLTSASSSIAPQGADGGSDKLTGARNENSVLFSLSALTGGGPSTPAAPERDRDPASNKADLRALMGSGGSAPTKSKIDDIMNLSGGGVYSPGLLASPALAPPPMDLMTAAVPADSGGSKSKSLMVAIGGGVLVIGAVAIAFTTMSSKADSTDRSGAVVASAAPGAHAPVAHGAANAPNEGTAEPAAAAGEPVRQGETARQPEAPAPEPAAVAVAPGSPAPKPETEKAEKSERKVAAAPKAEKPATAPAAAGLPPPPVAAPAPAPAPAPAAPAAAGGSGDFDRAAALSALSAAATAAQACKKPDGPTGSGRVAVTFANNGTATTANVEGPPFAGTPVGGCVAARFRSVHIPPFAGSVITVRKTFIIN
jgi:predicted Zn finger-like uncharacterized protein